MTPISQYSSDSDLLRLVLQGPSGTGKTTLLCQFPGVCVFDLDINLGGSIRFCKEKGLALPVGYYQVDIDKEGKPVELKNQFGLLNTYLKEAQLDPLVETIGLDSGTKLASILIAEICRQQNKNSISDWKDGRQFWGLFAPFCSNFFGTLAQMRKHVVLTVHEKTQKLESGAIVYPIKVAWPGQVGENIGIHFTNVWRTEVEKLPKGVNETTYTWRIRTMPDSKYELKNTLGLPATFEFKWETIDKALKGNK